MPPLETTPASPGVVLPWDSQFFGFKIGRACSTRLDGSEAERLLEWARAERLRCLYLATDPDCRVTLAAAHDAGFMFVDMRTDLSLSLRGWKAANVEVTCRNAGSEDIPWLEAVSRTAHTGTRFVKDAGFPRDRVSDLYAEWIRRDFREHRVLVACTSDDPSPVGYVTCQQTGASGVGRIGLIAVSDDRRGKGWGRILVHAAIQFFQQSGCKEIQVATQASNLPAQILYQAMGFRLHEVSATYHRWF